MSPSQAHNMLNQLVRAEPFRPFLIRLADGECLEVMDPRRLALPEHPSAGTCAAYVGDKLSIIGLDSIASIEV